MSPCCEDKEQTTRPLLQGVVRVRGDLIPSASPPDGTPEAVCHPVLLVARLPWARVVPPSLGSERDTVLAEP